MLFALWQRRNVLDNGVLLGKSVVLLDILGLPGIADPDVLGRNGSVVAAALHHVGRQNALLRLILVLAGGEKCQYERGSFTNNSRQMWGWGGTHVQDKDEEVGLLAFAAELLLGQLDVLLQFADGIFQGGAGVIDLVDDQDVLADQVGHLEGAQVEPLSTGDLGAGDLLGIAAAEVLVEGQTDGLDGDVGVTGALEEGTKGIERVRISLPLRLVWAI